MDYVCNSLKQIWEKEKLVQKGYKKEEFFTVIYPKISMLLRQCPHGKTLSNCQVPR